MSSNYAPIQGNIVVVDGFSSIKKYFLPNAQRSFPAGCPLWNNGANGVEPCLLSPTAAGHLATSASGTTYASTYTTDALFNAAFAPLFAGFAAEQRIPQQLASIGQFSAPGNIAQYASDASPGFIAVYDEGIAIGPCSALAAQHEVGELVGIQTFANEATTGFYDPAGCLQKDTDYYGYMNAVEILGTQTAANAIGILCERALAGQTFLKFKFKSALLSTAGVL